MCLLILAGCKGASPGMRRCSALAHGCRPRFGARPSPRCPGEVGPQRHAPPEAGEHANARSARSDKAKVLAALKNGPMTASQIAKSSGIGTGTVSTMLTKMAKSGELAKAERG
jgi:predicted Rossmann fold nucleotide-binding protein DprA/Smf involved in DNA uptake